jgi:hypothetical protein
MTCLRDAVSGWRGGVPRVCEDGPVMLDFQSICLEYSPHSRGWTDDLPVPHTNADVFPARAGMDRRRRR